MYLIAPWNHSVARRRWQASRRGATMTTPRTRATRENADEKSKVPEVTSGRVAPRHVASRRVAFRSVPLRCVFRISCRVSRCVLAHRTWRVATSHCAPGERGAAAPLHPSKPPPGRPVCHPCRGNDAPPPPPAARYYRLPPRGCGASAYSHTTDPARPCSIYLPVPERDDDWLT